MKTELYSLSKIFTENLFRIPDYQRGYSWTERQLKDFWTDLELLDESRDHYTGVLTLEEVPTKTVASWMDDLWIVESKRFSPFYVVDGQQRLTTALILLQTILDAVPDRATVNYSTAEEIRKKYIFESRDGGVSRSYIFGYEKDNPSYEYLKSKIFLEASDSHSVGETTIYTQNLLHARTFFSERVAKLAVSHLENLFTKLTQHFLFNIYVISGAIDVFVAFETMNNRGKPLSHLELLKNRLIYLSTRLEVDEFEKGQLRRTINESWKTAYHFLGRNESAPLDDDEFLSLQSFLYFASQGISSRAEDEGEDEDDKFSRMWRHHSNDYEFATFLLEKHFTSRNLKKIPDLNEQVESPTINAQILYEYSKHLKLTVETYYRLLNPSDAEYNSSVRIQLERLRRLGWRDAMPLGVAAAQSGASPEELNMLYSVLERLLFIRMIQWRGLYEELNLLQLAVQVLRSKRTVGDISAELSTICEKGAKTLDIAGATARWGKERGYYTWGGLRYFLFEYELTLKTRSKSDRNKLLWEEFAAEKYNSDYSTIEHVYPQRASHDYWKANFGHLTIKQRNKTRNSLGNLLALSRPKNAALSNRPFPEKRDGSQQSGGYRHGSYSEIEVSELQDWTPQTIMARGIKMLEFLGQRWAIPIGDQSQKLKALNIPFLGISPASDGSDDEEDEQG